MGTVKDINLNQKGSLPLLQLVVSKLKALNLEYFIEGEKYYQNMSTSSNPQAFPIEDTPAVQNYTENGENRTSFTLPIDFTQISKLNKQCVSVYSVLFFFAAVGNLLVLYSIFVYHVAQHPVYPDFHQCVTKAFLKNEPYNELVYNIGSVSALYFIPLVVVIYTYSMILLKLYRKSKEQLVTNVKEGQSPPTTSTPPSIFHSNLRTFYRKLSNSSSGNDSKKTRIILRCSENQRSTLNRACSRTLKLTLLILLMFIVCWTPYVTITLWYMLDRTGASQVDERLQEALFIMTVANSVINPFIYGTVGRKQRRRRKFRTPLLSVSVAKPNLTRSPFNGVALLKRKREAEFTIQNNAKGLRGQCRYKIYEHSSEGVHVMTLKKRTNFDTVLGFNPGIKRGKLGRRNNDFIISDRITI
ncbi:Gonadotropin-releasing hormone II receptor [Orchesella cincta]|uniref:Gonadotropin-releasing hormone II receptor n=1 Tax=Orchesella cincta TaxID=48709 RepID=A0A1D2MG31_ORCCI|nr:Gonadotropin-releasing hormone II receptor [Orchesella cincta]